jgi:hypothetical protein
MEREYPKLLQPIQLEDDPAAAEADRLVEQGYLTHDEAAMLVDPEQQAALHAYFAERGLLDDVVMLLDDVQ